MECVKRKRKRKKEKYRRNKRNQGVEDWNSS